MPPKRTILVTGAAGFIGSHLVRELLRQTEGTEIVALDDLSGGYLENLPQTTRVHFVKGSVTDHVLVKELFAKWDFEYVYHLAAYAAEGLSHFIRRFNYTNNVIGSVNLINESINRNVRCFVFTSSIAVYGEGCLPLREDTPAMPEDPYGIAKYAVELDLKSAKSIHGLNYVVFRPHNVYGEFQNIGDKYRNVVAIFMNQILRGEPMTIFGNGEQERAFTYVGDIVPTIAASAWTEKAYGGVYNIGADTPYTVNALAKAVGKAMGAPNHPIVHLDARKEVHIAYSDHTRLTQVFGESEHTSLSDGLARMSDWVHQTGSRESQAFQGIEVVKNLPPSWAKQTANRQPEATPL